MISFLEGWVYTQQCHRGSGTGSTIGLHFQRGLICRRYPGLPTNPKVQRKARSPNARPAVENTATHRSRSTGPESGIRGGRGR